MRTPQGKHDKKKEHKPYFIQDWLGRASTTWAEFGTRKNYAYKLIIGIIIYFAVMFVGHNQNLDDNREQEVDWEGMMTRPQDTVLDDSNFLVDAFPHHNKRPNWVLFVSHDRSVNPFTADGVREVFRFHQAMEEITLEYYIPGTNITRWDHDQLCNREGVWSNHCEQETILDLFDYDENLIMNLTDQDCRDTFNDPTKWYTRYNEEIYKDDIFG
jgi:hypothetical protein